MSEPDRDTVTTYLGTFDEFEEALVLEILEDHDIYAFAKNDPTEPEHSAYPSMMSDRGVLMVDAARVEDAQRILAEELPQHLASIRDAMADMQRIADDAESDDAETDGAEPDGAE